MFCSGKLYYELLNERERRRNLIDVALVRVELLYPFPTVNGFGASLEAYPGAEGVWCQEEPRNMGAWSHVALTWMEELPDVSAHSLRRSCLRRESRYGFLQAASTRTAGPDRRSVGVVPWST